MLIFRNQLTRLNEYWFMIEPLDSTLKFSSKYLITYMFFFSFSY
jgi:hypothetical protein